MTPRRAEQMLAVQHRDYTAFQICETLDATGGCGMLQRAGGIRIVRRTTEGRFDD